MKCEAVDPPSGPIVLLDTTTGRAILRPFPDDWHAEILGIAPDGRWVIGRDSQGGLHIVDTADGHERAGFLPQRTADGLTAWWNMATAPDVDGVVLIRNSDEIHFWDSATSGVRLVVRVAGGPNGVTGLWSAVRSPDRRKLAATCGERTTIMVWDAATGGELGRQHVSRLLGADPTFSPDGRNIQMFDARSGSERACYVQRGEFGRLLGFSPDGRTLWTEGHERGTVNIRGWDVTPAGPPTWLLALTPVGLVFVIADYWRGRRRSGSKLQAT
jgi:hypothetical protein